MALSKKLVVCILNKALEKGINIGTLNENSPLKEVGKLRGFTKSDLDQCLESSIGSGKSFTEQITLVAKGAAIVGSVIATGGGSIIVPAAVTGAVQAADKLLAAKEEAETYVNNFQVVPPELQEQMSILEGIESQVDLNLPNASDALNVVKTTATARINAGTPSGQPSNIRPETLEERLKRIAALTINKFTGKETIDPVTFTKTATVWKTPESLKEREAAFKALPTGVWTENQFRIYEAYLAGYKPEYDLRINPGNSTATIRQLNTIRQYHGLPTFKSVVETQNYLKGIVTKLDAKNALPAGNWSEGNYKVYEAWYATTAGNDIRKISSHLSGAIAIADRLNIARLSHGLPKKSTYELKYFADQGKWPSAAQIAAKAIAVDQLTTTPTLWTRFITLMNVRWPA